MNSIESIFFWSSAVLLAGSFFFSLLSLIFKKDFIRLANYFCLAGFITITILGIIRWSNTGHPPFVTRFESMITSIWFVLLIHQVIRLFKINFNLLLMPISLISFLMLGWASSLSAEASPLSEALTNVWLFIHASFATSGAASFLIAASFSVIVLMGESKPQTTVKLSAKIPNYKTLPKYILNFLIFGLILWGVMIVSGSIWANVAWGRYWAWDPIELWSLISWLLYGLLLHSRLTFKINHRLFCWMTIVASLIVVFALWGVGYLYETIHTYG